MEENLNKENFWNELYAKYPKGVQVFCDWVDEYKKKVHWGALFAALPGSGGNVGFKYPKYHDLPFAFQVGMWIEFVCERGGCVWEIEDLFSHDWREEITEYCKMLQVDAELDEEFDKADQKNLTQ